MYHNFARSLHCTQDKIKKKPSHWRGPVIAPSVGMLQSHAHTRASRCSLVVGGIPLERESSSLSRFFLLLPHPSQSNLADLRTAVSSVHTRQELHQNGNSRVGGVGQLSGPSVGMLGVKLVH